MTKTNSMEFVKTPLRIGGGKKIVEANDENYLNKISSGRLIVHLLQRHKFGLVTMWAVVITITYLFPPIWDILESVIS